MTAIAAAGGAIFLLAAAFSMLGLGGAILYVPLLVGLGFDLKAVAIPTALWLNGVTVLSAALYYLRAGLADLRGGWPMAVAAMLGAPLGAGLTGVAPERALLELFALALVVAAVHMGRPGADTRP
ncbi:sulfite exporter TauE/SafE family protein [Thiohalorhabdus sp.]|uniref:sulfite exporter TauE/SafE family protein n=1 Tax=Thiohalorhabdus sp. TaxID=3094134 RepID=UPI002FC306B8